jgi:hypothetical protein
LEADAQGSNSPPYRTSTFGKSLGSIDGSYRKPDPVIFAAFRALGIYVRDNMGTVL